jgi:hypothetical protein
MTEDTSEKVMHDLNLMETADLRLMARQNNLSFDGTKDQLLSRIKAAFGYGNEKEEKVSKINESKRASALSSSSTAGPTTSATAQTTLPRFVTDLEVEDEDEDVDLDALRKRKKPRLDLNLEAGEASGKV